MSNSFQYADEAKRRQLLHLAKAHGTPLYVYDEAVIRRQYRRLRSAFDSEVNLALHYAAKALSNPRILALMRELGAGLDAVSIEEVKLGLHAGFEPEKILFTPNNVGMDELNEAVALGVQINIDNIPMLELFAQSHPDYPIGIRINPHVQAGGNARISVGHVDSKFGISIHQLPHLLKLIAALNIRIEGLHMHAGSDILDTEAFLRASEIIFNTAEHFRDLRYLDFGSGFKVPYHPADMETEIEELGRLLSTRFRTFCEKREKEMQLIFEPGKFLVSQAGYFLAEVMVVKPTPSTLFAGINSGFNQFPRPMYYGAHHEIENLSNPEGRSRIYSVVGNVCETDTFASNRKLAEIREGDILCFYNAGAYCFSMASNYNSRLLPAEVLIEESGETRLIRKRQEWRDLLRGC